MKHLRSPHTIDISSMIVPHFNASSRAHAFRSIVVYQIKLHVERHHNLRNNRATQPSSSDFRAGLETHMHTHMH